MNCKSCNAVVTKEHIFCEKCGVRADGKTECAACKKLVPQGAVFCMYCGAAIKSGKGCCCHADGKKDDCCSHEAASSKKDKFCCREGVAKALNTKASDISKRLVILLITVAVFIASFFTTIKLKIDITQTGNDIEIRQSSVQLVGAMFALNKGYTKDELAEVMEQFEFDISKISSASFNEATAVKLGKAVSKINLLKLSLTDEKVLNSVSGSSIGIPQELLGAAKFQVVVYGVLVLAQMLVSACFMTLIILSFLLKKKMSIANIALYIQAAIAIMLAIVLMPNAYEKLGVSVALPLAICSIGIILQLAYGILKAGKELKLKPLCYRACSAAIALVLVFSFGFSASNKIRIEYQNYNSDRVYNIKITPFMYSAAFITQEEVSSGILEGLHASYGQIVTSPMRDFLTGDSIFAGVNDKEYDDYYYYVTVMSQVSAVTFLLAIALFLWQLFSALHKITQNKNKKHEFITSIFAFAFVAFTLTVSILFSSSMSDILSDFASETLSVSVKLSSGVIFTLALTAVSIICTLVFNHLIGGKNRPVAAQENIAGAGIESVTQSVSPSADVSNEQTTEPVKKTTASDNVES